MDLCRIYPFTLLLAPRSPSSDSGVRAYEYRHRVSSESVLSKQRRVRPRLGYLQRVSLSIVKMALPLLILETAAARLPFPLYLSMVEEPERLSARQQRMGAAEGTVQQIRKMRRC